MGILEQLKDKNVLVIGFGKSGKAIIKAVKNAKCNIYLYEDKDINEFSCEDVEFVEALNVSLVSGKAIYNLPKIDLAIASPGVPRDIAIFKLLEQNGVNIIGELELAFRIARGRFVAITGTNGKTTTTTLVSEIFKKAGFDTRTVGNIGNPVVHEAMNSSDDTIFVTEVSSFQLEGIEEFRAVASSILNITPDHLDRHKTMENYIEAKARIFENQSEDDFFVYNHDDEILKEVVGACTAKIVPFSRLKELDFGVFVKDGAIVIRNNHFGMCGQNRDLEERLVNSLSKTDNIAKSDSKRTDIGLNHDLTKVCSVDDLQIPGSHNVENALAAVAMTYFYGIDICVIAETLKTFMGVEHRLEYVDEFDGVRFINDSKGTNKDASIKAVEAMKAPTVLIAGGYDKNSDYKELIESFKDKVKAVVLMGATAERIKREASELGFTNSYIVKDMRACVAKAFELAKSGYNILLSPACASWDMYESYEMRGKDFKECVKLLKMERHK